jgi:tetratricopeptide (TPR) repeat protein
VLQAPSDQELADRSFRRGDLETAVDLYKQVLASNPEGAERAGVMYRLAVSYSVPDSPVYNPEQAAVLLTELSNDPHCLYSTDAKLILGLTSEVAQLRLVSSDKEQLIQKLSAELEKVSDRESLREQLNIAEKYFTKGEYEKASAAYLKYLEISPNPPEKDRALFHLAICYAFPDSPVHDLAKAEELLNGLVSDPDTAHGSDAELLLRLGAQIRALRTANSRQTREIEQLSDELERLKEIDLQTPRSSVPD